MRENIQEIKRQVDIISVAEDLGCLPPKRGRVFQDGKCPVGHESTGGKCFTIYPDTQTAHCYHCGQSWDVIGLVQQVKGFDFISACNWLCDKYSLPHLQTSDLNPEEKAEYEVKVKERRTVFEILTVAARFYHQTLMNDEEMKSHLISHYGLNEETITIYTLGYSKGMGLLDHLRGLDYLLEQIILTGLFVKVDGAWKEFFQDRIVFPYWNCGQVVYFIGRKTARTLDHKWEQMKYKKLPLKNRSRSYVSEFISNKWFYGEDAIRRADTIYMVEGVTDYLAMQQADYPTFSLTTTRLSNNNLKRVERLLRNAGTVYLVPDCENNRAGINGVLDTAETLENLGKSAYIISLPRPEDLEKVDAADFLRDHDKEDFDRLIDEAKTPLQIEIDEIAKENLDLIRLPDRLKPVKEKLAQLPMDKVSGYLNHIKTVLKLNSDFVKALTHEIGVLKRAAHNDKIEREVEAQSSIVENPDPCDGCVEGEGLLGEMQAAIRKHIVLDEPAITACSLWVVLTYTVDAFRILPMLAVTSPEKRCGKTTLLEVLQGLVKAPLLSSNISPSAIFRTIEKYRPCLLIDEADNFIKGNDELRGIINSGHTKTSAFVIRTNTESLEPERFSTWGPKVISMIGELPDTNKDRSIPIRMKRKTADEKTQRLTLDFNNHHLTLRRQCERWAQDNMAILRNAEPAVPETGNDRATDNWSPLMAIADLAGGEWPVMARKAMSKLETESDKDTIRQQALSDINEIFESQKKDKITSKILVEALKEMEDRPWSDWRQGKSITQTGLARLLKPFGICSKVIRIGDKTARGYTLNQFADAFERYVSPINTLTPPIQTVTPSQTMLGNDFRGFQNVTPENIVTVEKARTREKNVNDTFGEVSPLRKTSFTEAPEEVVI